VKELAGQERPIVVDRKTNPERPLRVRVSSRYDAKEIEEPLSSIGDGIPSSNRNTTALTRMIIHVAIGGFLLGTVSRMGNMLVES
jgi:hypothetical protein